MMCGWLPEGSSLCCLRCTVLLIFPEVVLFCFHAMAVWLGPLLVVLVQVRSSEPAHLGLIQVSCPVRQAMAIQVSLTNPTDKPLPLKVKYSTQSVVGPSSFVAPPGAPSIFECFYTPLLVGTEEGSLTMISNEVGQTRVQDRGCLCCTYRCLSACFWCCLGRSLLAVGPA